MQCGLLSVAPDTERLALLLGALCHDLEHPVPPPVPPHDARSPADKRHGWRQGVSSQFLINTASPLADLYDGDPGCLEQHHAFRAFELLAGPAADDDEALLAPLLPGARRRRPYFRRIFGKGVGT